MSKKRVLISWSSGKDSAWLLHTLQQDPSIEIVGLFSTANEEFERVAMHAVRMQLVEMQAEAAGLPLEWVMIPNPCDNETYSSIMKNFMKTVVQRKIDAIAFGDLFLEDVRDYRINNMEGTGVEPIFPIFGSDTHSLCQEMIASGLKAQLTCIDPKKIPEALAGHAFNRELISKLPNGVDPCGEFGEFHSFAFDGPMFNKPIAITVGETVERDGYFFTDLHPAY